MVQVGDNGGLKTRMQEVRQQVKGHGEERAQRGSMRWPGRRSPGSGRRGRGPATCVMGTKTKNQEGQGNLSPLPSPFFF